MPRARVFEGSQWGPEAVDAFGTAVAATRIATGTIISPKTKVQHQNTRGRGSRMISGGIVNKEWTEGPVEQDPAQFNEFSYLMSMFFGKPSISLVSSGVWQHDWNPLNWTGFTPQPFTVESGSYTRAKKSAYTILKTLGMDFTRNNIKAMGEILAQKTTRGITLTPGTAEVQTMHKTGTVTGGTFTLGYLGETTTAIAFGATAGTIQTALLLFASLDAGDVVVTGGPAGTSDVVFTFGGKYASGDVPLIVIDGTLLTGGGSYGMTETTPGAPLALLTNAPLAGSMWDFYIDSAAASWGTTKYTGAYKASWQISDLWGPDWTANTSNTSWKQPVDLAPGTRFQFTLEQDSTGDALMTQLAAGTLIYPQIKVTGPTLVGSTYSMVQNFCVELTDVSDDEDQDGVVGVTYTGEIADDPTTKKFISFSHRTNLAAIA